MLQLPCLVLALQFTRRSKQFVQQNRINKLFRANHMSQLLHFAPPPCEYTRPRTTVCRTLPGKLTPSNGDHPHFVFNDPRVTVYGFFKSSTVNEPTYPSSTRPNPLP